MTGCTLIEFTAVVTLVSDLARSIKRPQDSSIEPYQAAFLDDNFVSRASPTAWRADAVCTFLMVVQARQCDPAAA